MNKLDCVRSARDSHSVDATSVRVTVALLGREEPGDENLALRYLSSALERAGHAVEI